MAYTTITGNVGKDIEVKQSNNGKSFARFSIAWSERVKDPQGNWDDGPTQWVFVTCFGRVAENLAMSAGKGVRVIVTGHLRAETWSKDTGEETVLTMTADNVGIDLTFQVAQVSKANAGNQGQGGWNNTQPQGGFGQQPQGGFGQAQQNVQQGLGGFPQGQPQGGFGQSEETPF